MTFVARRRSLRIDLTCTRVRLKARFRRRPQGVNGLTLQQRSGSVDAHQECVNNMLNGLERALPKSGLGARAAASGNVGVSK